MSGPSILIVEDELLIRLALGEYLSEAGFVVLEAANAREAMDLLKRERVDAVFTDVRMPGDMDGIGLAKWLLQHRPGLPVMLTSGEMGGIKAMEELCRSRHVSAFAKPYRYADVEKRIREALTESGKAKIAERR